MAYTPPATTDINFDLAVYTAPATSDINFEIGGTLATITGTLAISYSGMTVAGAGTVRGVVVSIDHSTGDLTQYTTTVTDGGNLSVAAGAALAGTNYGLSCFINDTTVIYGEKTITADTSGILRVRFYFDPNTLTMSNSDNFVLCMPRNASAGCAYIQLIKVGSDYAIRALIINDAGGNTTTSSYTITDAPHYLEFKLLRATGASTNDGSLQLWIDGVDKETISGIDNYTRFDNFTSIRLGALVIIPATVSGTFYLDELVVNNSGDEIGPVALTPATGTASITLAGQTNAGVGNVEINGSLAKTFAGMTVSGVGNVEVNGILNGTMAGMTLAGTGEVSGAIPVPVVTQGAGYPLWKQLFDGARIIEDEEEMIMLAMLL